MGDRILRFAEVLEVTGLARSSLLRRVKDGTFPAPVRLGGDRSRAVGWLRSEVDEWITSRPRATESPHGRRQRSVAFRPRSEEVSIRVPLWDIPSDRGAAQPASNIL